MKKTIIILSILATQVIHAQTEKGKFLLGASVNYSQGKTTGKNENSLNLGGNDSKNMNLGANLRLGYFFAKNIAAGILVTNNYSHGSTKQTDNSDPSIPRTSGTQSNGNTATLGIFGRGYKLFAGDRFGFFCELSAAYLMGNNKTTYTNSSPGFTTTGKTHSDQTGFNVGLRPGFAYFITKKIGLEVSVGNLAFNTQKSVSYSEEQKTQTTTNNNFNFNLSASTLYLGATFYLGGKKN